jgi:hypothetical protein
MQTLRFARALLVFAAATASPVLATESAPAASTCYRTEPLRLASTPTGPGIAGDLTLPQGKGPFPAVQMITGSGPHTRDQVISGTPMFRQIAQHLARRGMAVARTDARGFGATGGVADFEAHTTAERAADNRRVFEYLGAHPQVDASRRVLFGHSEGAIIAVSLAASGEQPALLVLMGPSALPGGQVLAAQQADHLLRQGASQQTADAVRGQLHRFFDFLAKGGQHGPEFEAIAMDFLVAHGVDRDSADPAVASGLLSGYLASRWDRYFASHDPRPELESLAVPVAALFAGEDQNVPWRMHLPAMAQALAKAPTTDVALTVIPGQDHFFLEFEGKRLDPHRQGEMVVAPSLLAAIDVALVSRGLDGQPCVD